MIFILKLCKLIKWLIQYYDEILKLALYEYIYTVCVFFK